MMTIKIGETATVTFYTDNSMNIKPGGLFPDEVEQLRKILNDRAAPFKPTHHFLAQGVRLLEQRDGKNLVEFSDGSIGWHDDVLIPVCLVTPPYHWLGADATP